MTLMHTDTLVPWIVNWIVNTTYITRLYAEDFQNILIVSRASAGQLTNVYYTFPAYV